MAPLGHNTQRKRPLADGTPAPQRLAKDMVDPLHTEEHHKNNAEGRLS